MKFLCSGCSRLLDVERFRLEGPSLVVTCQSCGAESRSGPGTAAAPAVAPAPLALAPLSNVTPLRVPTVEAISRAASAANEKAFEAPPGHCPKCIAKRVTGALACPSCGLVFEQATTNAFDPSEWLKGQWLRLLGGWGDEAAHESVRAEAMNQGELAQLGRLYRLRLADQPDDPYAQRGRDEVLRLAVLPQISARQIKGEQEVPMWKYAALSAVILGCLVALFFLVQRILTQS